MHRPRFALTVGVCLMAVVSSLGVIGSPTVPAPRIDVRSITGPSASASAASIAVASDDERVDVEAAPAATWKQYRCWERYSQRWVDCQCDEERNICWLFFKPIASVDAPSSSSSSSSSVSAWSPGAPIAPAPPSPPGWKTYSCMERNEQKWTTCHCNDSQATCWFFLPPRESTSTSTGTAPTAVDDAVVADATSPDSSSPPRADGIEVR
ncbi:uncharacterized protein PFL1_06086 [Pseudozyma flocculosa PF-1]|uniref:Uncharacterized protein n=2 Tax=Pseudozyma flocculosa TaxID=84751 RepID=A0A5C3F3F5_9BASI|nr:uncharacterized protein PFL1_06086 [Pseudozyma flocculosa PF-1]EPQ26438.1 hypothetical protein PFL1_06086 [Pseudozyma flocculosa PF-1]SPO38968.1 uncharacterized protein PSFLO_04447 [Pseudozyma flocculosa]